MASRSIRWPTRWVGVWAGGLEVWPLLFYIMYYEWCAISDSSDIHFVAQGNIGPGAKLEDGKGTAASGALAFFFKTVPLSNYKKYKVTCTARSGANSAMKMFQKRDELGTSDMSTKLNTTHQNQVSEVYLFLLWASLKLFSPGEALLWRQSVGRNSLDCSRRRKTGPLGSCGSQVEGSQDLETPTLLAFRTRQISWHWLWFR